MREFIFKNIALKLLALTFAIALWFFVVGERGSEIGFLIPLELKGLPSELMVINEVQSLIDVRVSGPRRILADLSPAQMGITIDLSESKAGSKTHQIFPKDVKVSRGLKVTRVSPSSIKLVLEPLITRELPVKVYITGRPKKGFKVGNVLVDPPDVQVTGAEGGLKNLKALSTRPIDIEGLDKDLKETVPLDISELNVIKIDFDTVEVQMEILKKSE
ncbi:MAG: YbbR-like domain-containing protein [Thermodesulfobacteriota bacterium]